MKVMNKEVLKILILPVLAAAVPFPVFGQDEEAAQEKDMKHIVLEAREAAMEWAEKIRDLRSGEPRKTTYLGVVIESVPSVLRDYVDLPKGAGLLLSHVASDGPAANAGLQDNDILVKLDDQLIVNHSQLSTLLEMKSAGDTVKLTILRKGEQMEFQVTLEERIRKGIRFMPPNPPDAPHPPHVPDVGQLMEQIDEWIPGSVRVFIDENERVHVDMDDLKNDLEGLRTKLARIHVIDENDVDNIVLKHGDSDARTTILHVADKNINFVSDQGKVHLNSTSSGKHVKVLDENDELIYEGPLPENYAEELPPKAVELIDSLEAIEFGKEDKHIEVELHTDHVNPVTMLTEGE